MAVGQDWFLVALDYISVVQYLPFAGFSRVELMEDSIHIVH